MDIYTESLEEKQKRLEYLKTRQQKKIEEYSASQPSNILHRQFGPADGSGNWSSIQRDCQEIIKLEKELEEMKDE